MKQEALFCGMQSLQDKSEWSHSRSCMLLCPDVKGNSLSYISSPWLLFFLLVPILDSCKLGKHIRVDELGEMLHTSLILIRLNNDNSGVYC